MNSFSIHRLFPFALLVFLSVTISKANTSPYPLRGLCIEAPSPQVLDQFVDFIDEELAPAGVNTLILRVDFQYEYQSRPELIGNNPLTQEQIKKLVAICRKNDIRLIPQINLLGHQSWHTTLGKLLEVYPEFDETPDIQLPEKYEWPNDDGLYCKSYCTLHPEVHEVVFDLVDEIVEVFETDAFHAGLDEVFYIGHDNCDRCRGRDPAVLFADEVNRIHNHLQNSGAELWMWGDRLIDGRTTGIGLWEGSYNNTHRAIDLISKDVVICDWHYERPDPTAVLFAAAGFRVATCPWRKPDIAIKQDEMMRTFIENATPDMKPRYLGMLQTVWSSAEHFMKEYHHPEQMETEDNSGNCFRALSEIWKE